MYEWAAGDIRGITTELVRGPTPEAARAQCIARGVPAEHVSTWAVENTEAAHAAEVKSLRDEHEEALYDANAKAEAAEAIADEAKEEADALQSKNRRESQRVEELERALADITRELRSAGGDLRIERALAIAEKA